MFLEPARKAVDLVESGESSGRLVAAVGASRISVGKRNQSAYPGNLCQKEDLLGAMVPDEYSMASLAVFCGFTAKNGSEFSTNRSSSKDFYIISSSDLLHPFSSGSHELNSVAAYCLMAVPEGYVCRSEYGSFTLVRSPSASGQSLAFRMATRLFDLSTSGRQQLRTL